MSLIEQCLRCRRIVLCPYSYKLVQMVSSQNGGVPGKIVKIVHNNSNEQVKHKKGAQEDECYKVGISEI